MAVALNYKNLSLNKMSPLPFPFELCHNIKSQRLRPEGKKVLGAVDRDWSCYSYLVQEERQNIRQNIFLREIYYKASQVG